MQNIDSEKIYQYYIIENHSRQESASIFGISESKLKKICSDKEYRCAMQVIKSISNTISQIKLIFSKNNYLFKNK